MARQSAPGDSLRSPALEAVGRGLGSDQRAVCRPNRPARRAARESREELQVDLAPIPKSNHDSGDRR